MPDSTPLPEVLRQFVAACRWTFAKTYAPDWPHEYIVRKNVDEELFVQLVLHIRAHGYEGRFYEKPITYFDEGGMVYWTMGSPIEKTVIINRCQKEQTYEERSKNGTLPKKQPLTASRLAEMLDKLTPDELLRFESVMQGVLSGKPPESHDQTP